MRLLVRHAEDGREVQLVVARVSSVSPSRIGFSLQTHFPTLGARDPIWERPRRVKTAGRGTPIEETTNFITVDPSAIWSGRRGCVRQRLSGRDGSGVVAVDSLLTVSESRPFGPRSARQAPLVVLLTSCILTIFLA